MSKLHKTLEDETHQKRKLEEEIVILRSQLLQLTFEADQVFDLRFFFFLFLVQVNLSILVMLESAPFFLRDDLDTIAIILLILFEFKSQGKA